MKSDNFAWAFELTPEELKRTEDVDALLATNAGAAAHRNDPRFEQLLTVNEYVGH